MVETRNDFDTRLKTLGRKHRALAQGSITQVRKDGLIVVKPSRRRAQRNFPVRMFVFLILGFFAFKGYLLASIGEVAYNDRLAKLEAGTAVEQVGAVVMRADRVSILMSMGWSALLSE